ncbi:MAG: metallophosphoesterase [Candidatus Hydrogenedentes bacterium]|nr:metallophosphoesterase [Candidatus Hydrogenedentota bacterium]
MKRRTKVLAASLLLGALCALAIAWATTSPGDLSLLEPYYGRFARDVALSRLESADGPRDTFTFVVLGDNRNNLHMGTEVFEQAKGEGPVLIVNTGDIVRGGTVGEYLENYIPLLELVDPIPVFCVPGNHERGDRHDYAGFRAIHGEPRFSFDYGRCRFVGFNASEKLCVNSAELAFLDEELGKPGADYRFVFFHVPPKYFEGTVASNDRRGFEWNAEELRAILVKHRVTEVFMGHIHGYATSVIDGVRYTLSAGAGAPLSDRLPPEGQVYNYMVLHVSPDGLREEVVYLDPDSREWIRREVYAGSAS